MLATRPTQISGVTFSTTYWGERPVIKVRYCNTAGTICSAGQTLVKPQSDTKSWQIRIKSAYTTDRDNNPATCTAARPQYVNFGADDDSGAFSAWLGNLPNSIGVGEWQAEYQLDGSTSWTALDDSRQNFLIPRGVATIKKMRFWFQPNGGYTSDLEKVQVTLDVTC